MNLDLEKIIDLAVADGVLTDKEREVIYRKATEYGEDLDEVELYISGKLAQSTSKSPSGHSVKHGVIKKCPSCGKDWKGLDTICECGYEISDVEASKTIRSLFEKFQTIEKQTEYLGVNSKARKEAIVSKKSAAIRDFPVPHYGEELLQLILFIKPKLSSRASLDPNYEDWKIKFLEILDRARFAYKDNSKMLEKINSFEQETKLSFSSLTSNHLKSNLLKYAVLGLAGLMLFGFVIYKQDQARCEAKFETDYKVEKEKLENLQNLVLTQIQKKDYEGARTNLTKMHLEIDASCKKDEINTINSTWLTKKEELASIIKSEMLKDEMEKQAKAEKEAAEQERILEQQRLKESAEQAKLEAEKLKMENLQRQQVQDQNHQNMQRQFQGQQQAPNNVNPGLQIFGTILNHIMNEDRKK